LLTSTAVTFIDSIVRGHILALHGVEKRPEEVGGQWIMLSDANANFYQFGEMLWTKYGYSGKPPYRFWLGSLLGFGCSMVDFLTHGWINHFTLSFLSPAGFRINSSPVTFGRSTKAQTLLGWAPTPFDVGVDKAVARSKASM